MKSVLVTGSAEREKDLVRRTTKIALVMCLAALGTAIEARADCKDVRGQITETAIPSPNDPIGRVLGNVHGALNGAITSFVTGISPNPAPFIVLHATCVDVIVTNGGAMLAGTGAVTMTPVPGRPPGDFTTDETLKITGGSGTYAGATGTITLKGQSRNVFGGPGVGTFNGTYRGSVCAPNLNAGGN